MMHSSDVRRGGLARYVVAATLARTSDGGAVVGVVLLVTTVGGPPWAAGLLGACITFPHLIGPFIARVLDTARDGRNVLALACILHAATLAAAVVLYDVVWIGIPAVLLIASGALGPLLTGGISSRLPAIAGPEREMQRRAQGWDVATYGIGGTVGPTVVAVIAAAWNPTAAVLVLAGSAAFAAFLVKMLPSAEGIAASDVPRPLRTLSLMIRSGPLRRTLYGTIAIALSVAVLPVVAVAGTTRFDVAPAAAGFLTATYGLGSFAGSVGVMVRPLRGDADKAMSALAACVGVSLFGVFVSGHIGWVIAAYGLTGILNSYFFAATLAARSEYAPVAARSQVFVWVGALKITAGSLGTATAGTLIAMDAWLPVILASAVAVTSAGVATLDRLTSRPGKGSGS